MKPDEFIDWLGIKPDLKGIAMVTLEGVIAKAIAEHEAGQWRKYPENKPGKGFWFVQFKKGGFGIWSSGNWQEWKKYIEAFRELPKHYQSQEGGENG